MKKIEEDLTQTNNSGARQSLVENKDFYFENGLMVLTAYFLRKRGYCCQNNCRHCPYQNEKKTKDYNKNSANGSF